MDEEDRMSLDEPAALPEIELNKEELDRNFINSLNTEDYVELKRLCYAISDTIFFKMNFKLTLRIIDNNHLFFIKDLSNQNICSTNISLSEHSFPITVVGHLRELNDEPAFYVVALDTDENYRGRGYASLLLIFGLSYLKIVYPEYKFSLLDDDTDKSSQIEGDIYTNLGYQIRADENIKLSHIKSNKLESGNTKQEGFGPERILYLGTVGGINHLADFIRRGNRALRKKSFLSGGNLTKKKYKKNRKSKKLKKNRKSKKYKKY